MTYVVIGANYGDEGKGLMTDFLARQERTKMVARFNGGAQAGHTVVLPTGKSHVFSHIGSGHFAGSSTMLGSRFLVNPLLLERELHQLRSPTWPSIEAHPSAEVTTIYDMLLNAAVETARGTERHGSCGLGINETVTRAQAGFSLKFEDAKSWNTNDLADFLEHIAKNWLPQRLEQLGIRDVAADIKTPMGLVYSTHGYKAHAKAMIPGMQHIGVASKESLGLCRHMGVVFEGAQGLALDEMMGHFPHVTRSLTGLPYAIELAAEMGIKKLTPLYVTRAYATRHGRGPLPYEGLSITENNIIDLTNVTNEWQESLRFAPLHVGELRARIEADLERSKTIAHMHGVELADPELAVTCLDQLAENVRIITAIGSSAMTLKSKDLPRVLGMQTGVTVRYTSYGSTFDKVTRHDRSGV